MTAKASVAVQRRDRPWIDAYVTVLCGPFEMPSTVELRRAVQALADRYPQSRLTWSLDPAKRHWRDDRDVESIVAERGWDDSTEIGARLDAIACDSSLQPPMTLIRYPRHVGLRMSHALGDGRLFLTIIAAVLQTALTGEVAPWPVQPGGPFPLITAAARTFGRRPTLLKSAIDDRVPLGAESAPVERLPWTPSRHTCHAAMTREQADEVFSWGREFAPGATRFALQVALVLRALKKAGIEISTDVRVIVDLRRYLAWRYIDGNFVAGVSMRISSSMSPAEISSNIKASNTSGRPILGYMLAQMNGGSAMPTPTSVDASGLPRVTFTNMGKSPEIDSLPFLTEQPTVYAGSVPPEGPLGLTILTGETSRVMTIDATFHDNVVNREQLAEALSLATSDPIGLLSAPAGSL